MIIQPGFNETEFETVLNMFYIKFVSQFPNFDFHIPSRYEENGLGYDFKKRSGIPFYFQYKVSDLYIPHTKSPLEKDRIEHHTNDSLGFFVFKPHKYKDGKYNQHNLLFKYARNNFYVAPKFITRQNLNDLAQDILLNSCSLSARYVYTLDNKKHYFPNRVNVNFLDNCFYLKPHKRINDTNSHYYTYNIEHQTIFHSEHVGVEESLVNIIESIYTQILDYEKYKIDFQEITFMLYMEMVENLLEDYAQEYISHFKSFLVAHTIIFERSLNASEIFSFIVDISPSLAFQFYRQILQNLFDIKLLVLENNNY